MYSVNNYSNNIIIEHTHITYSCIVQLQAIYSCLYAIGLSLANSMCWCRVSCRKYNVTSSQSSLLVTSALYYYVTDYNATHIPRTNLLLVTLETAVGSYQDNGRLVNKRYFARH